MHCVVSVDVDGPWIKFSVHQNLNDSDVALICRPMQRGIFSNFLRIGRLSERVKDLICVQRCRRLVLIV